MFLPPTYPWNKEFHLYWILQWKQEGNWNVSSKLRWRMVEDCLIHFAPPMGMFSRWDGCFQHCLNSWVVSVDRDFIPRFRNVSVPRQQPLSRIQWCYSCSPPCIGSCLHMQLDVQSHHPGTARVLLLDHIHWHLSLRWRVFGNMGARIGAAVSLFLVCTHTQVLANSLETVWSGKVLHCFHMLVLRPVRDMAQLFNFFPNKVTLWGFKLEVSSDNSFQDKLEGSVRVLPSLMKRPSMLTDTKSVPLSTHQDVLN